MSFDVNVREVTFLRVTCGSCCDGGPDETHGNEAGAYRAAHEHIRAHSDAWYRDDEEPGVLCLAKEHTPRCRS